MKDNLLAFDADAALRALAEANVALVRRFDRIMAGRSRCPAEIRTEEEVEGARRLAALLAAHRDLCRKARLADLAPLRAFAARAERFFKGMEADLAQARAEVLACLTEAATRRAPRQVSSLARGPDAGAQEPAGARPAAPQGASRAIPLAWHVADIDREAVDLEALRPFLTEAALLAAARAHLKANGPHDVWGVGYRQVAAV